MKDSEILEFIQTNAQEFIERFLKTEFAIIYCVSILEERNLVQVDYAYNFGEDWQQSSVNLGQVTHWACNPKLYNFIDDGKQNERS